jgi:glycosyltransferase involved in cell wall biosynthesis
MKFSILISSYNKANYIEKCIQSCLEQSYKSFEIILIDNYSNDGTDIILKKYEKNIIVKKVFKVSSYSSVNQIDLLKKAFQISKGEVVCLLDADDYFETNKLEKLKAIFSEKREIEVVFDKPKILINSNINYFKIKKKYSKYIWPTTHPTSSISIKRSFFETILEKRLFDNYPFLEIDFRITGLSKIIYKNFFVTEEKITVYRKVSDGIMSQIKKFSIKWWIKRLDAHYFIHDIYQMYKIPYKKNYDFYITKLIVYLLNKQTN